MHNDIIAISEEDMPEIIKLFDDSFYFMTTYPDLVSYEELKLFLINYGSAFKIIEDENLVGLAFYRAFNNEDVFFKFRTKTMNEADVSLLRKFISIIINEQKEVKRIQTSVFEFDHSERYFLSWAGIPYETRKKYSAFKDGKSWSSIEYSLVQSEIIDFIESVNVLEGENIGVHADKVNIQRHEAKHDQYLEYIAEKQEMLVVLQDIPGNPSSGAIAHKVSAKKIFPFCLNVGNRTAGYVSLVDVDWENRNGRIVCGVYEAYMESTELEYIRIGLEKMLDFCRSSLGLKKVWGIIRENNTQARKLLEGLFELESTPGKKDVLYYGYILE